MKYKGLIIFIAVVTVIFLSDRFSKNYIKNNFELYETKQIIGDYVRINYITNEGIAFGAFQDYGNIFLILAPLSLVFIMIYFIKYEKKNKFTYIIFSFIIGGALGNIYDRILYGSVIDFIDVDIPDINFSFYQLHRWPVFNIADFTISVGIIIYIIYTIFYSNTTE